VLAALAWMRAHLPPDEPAVLLQGDLLPQNLLLSLYGEPPGIADWEFAQRGDPAHDLAIVTRAKRGEQRIALEAYAAKSGRELPLERVRFHEVALLLGFYRDAVQEGVRENERKRLRSFLRRLGG
jgi:aminoglycoside phosphotransferase (APT) family kinase protein